MKKVVSKLSRKAFWRTFALTERAQIILPKAIWTTLPIKNYSHPCTTSSA